MNNAIIGGKINSAIEIRETSSTIVGSMTLQMAPIPGKETSGSLRVVTFGAVTESLQKLFESAPVIVTGRLKVESREVDGVKAQAIELIASNIITTPFMIPVNAVSLVGRTGRDPEVKYFESGTSLSSTSIAVNRRSKDGTDWFNVQAWGKTAQILTDYARKGSQIGIVGDLRFEYWSDRNTGAPRSKHQVNINDLTLLGSKSESSGFASSGGQFVTVGGGEDAPF